MRKLSTNKYLHLQTIFPRIVCSLRSHIAHHWQKFYEPDKTQCILLQPSLSCSQLNQPKSKKRQNLKRFIKCVTLLRALKHPKINTEQTTMNYFVILTNCWHKNIHTISLVFTYLYIYCWHRYILRTPHEVAAGGWRLVNSWYIDVSQLTECIISSGF